MHRIMVSQCLLGMPVRFDGASRPLSHPLLRQWEQEGRLIAVCPELLGGLSVPRAPAEIIGGTAQDVLAGRARVCTIHGEDVTQAFVHGAQQVRQLAKQYNCRFALLKESSPSCGVHQVHDGSFSGVCIAGEGIAAVMLRAAGLRVFCEHELDALAAALRAAS